MDDDYDERPFIGQPMSPEDLLDPSALELIKGEIRVVSIEEARSELPKIGRAISEMQAIHDLAGDVTDEIEILLETLPLGHPHITEMTDHLAEMVHEWQGIGEDIEPLAARMVTLDPGQAEWHGVVDGQLVLYSWCQGEEDIEWWIPLGESTTERRPLIEA